MSRDISSQLFVSPVCNSILRDGIVVTSEDKFHGPDQAIDGIAAKYSLDDAIIRGMVRAERMRMKRELLSDDRRRVPSEVGQTKKNIMRGSAEPKQRSTKGER